MMSLTAISHAQHGPNLVRFSLYLNTPSKVLYYRKVNKLYALNPLTVKEQLLCNSTGLLPNCAVMNKNYKVSTLFSDSTYLMMLHICMYYVVQHKHK